LPPDPRVPARYLTIGDDHLAIGIPANHCLGPRQRPASPLRRPRLSDQDGNLAPLPNLDHQLRPLPPLRRYNLGAMIPPDGLFTSETGTHADRA
jgi:hypothetical protein